MRHGFKRLIGNPPSRTTMNFSQKSRRRNAKEARSVAAKDAAEFGVIAKTAFNGRSAVVVYPDGTIAEFLPMFFTPEQGHVIGGVVKMLSRPDGFECVAYGMRRRGAV